MRGVSDRHLRHQRSSSRAQGFGRGGGGEGGYGPPPLGRVGRLTTPPPPLQLKHGENIHTCQICQAGGKKRRGEAPLKLFLISSNFCKEYDSDYRKNGGQESELAIILQEGGKCVLRRRFKIVLEYVRQCGTY